MSKEPSRPSDALVQELLAERRELRVSVERMKLEVEDAKRSAGGADPKIVKDLQDEVERLRYQLASARAEANHLREERDELRTAIQRAIEQMEAVSE